MIPSIRLALAWLAAFIAVSPVRGDDAKSADLTAKAVAILKSHCHRCHGQDGANEGGFNYVLDRRQLVNRNKIIPGDTAKSKLFKRLISADDPMPPEEEKSRPSRDEIELVRKWIEAGAPDVGVSPPQRSAISQADIPKAIRGDLQKVAERDRRFTRYFTLSHLHNAGLSADEMQSYRHGLSKLINSLSWGPRVVVPKPIDAAATVFRIDLRDYQWNENTWEAIQSANPYGITITSDDSTFCTEATRCRMPFVRGDWFVASAARPPLYHNILKLPESDRELEKVLRVDVAENIRQEKFVRAGFNGSGVSRNNRLIERHESGSVVYWKSYDFVGNTGRNNLFAHPLGPGDGEQHFQHDGGEIIFNLPNGLQGYLLVDGKGRRIDKGPTAVVSDPKRPDRAVENGLSCMSCHAKGLIEKNDQIRGHVLKNPSAFAQADLESVKALYVPTDELTALIRKDAKRFQDAVLKTGAPLSVTEPVAALALRFEAEMDLPLVAAEAGVSPDALLKALDRSAALAKALGAIKSSGGTVQRQVFVDAFAELVSVLKLGEHQPARNAVRDRLIREADELAKKGEQSRAIAAYSEALRHDSECALAHNNRGLAYKRQGDFERAIADFTAALRLDERFTIAFHNRGAAFHARSDLDRAIADYSESLRLDPISAIAFNNRGYTHLEKGNVNKALADFDQALRIDARFAFALNNRGLAFGRNGEHTRAIADFTAAIEINSKFAKAFWNRSLAHEKLGDMVRARADRAKALELDPNLDKE
jgi:tetratricopeptide (TPR) repeat protein/mono/diheme cytochrome c family protein